MRTNAKGIALIKVNEGCELTAYVCPAGKLTIGYGDTGPHVVRGMKITEAEAERLLAARLEREFEKGVQQAIGDAPTTSNQFSAMVSLAYNIGVGGFQNSSVARYHKAGEYSAAAQSFHLWNKGGGRVLAGLVRRRKEEADLYMKADEEEDG